MSKTCTGPECSNVVLAKNLCNGHYSQNRLGKTLTPLRPDLRTIENTPEGHKWCNGCKNFKKREEFGNRKGNRPQPRCKMCVADYIHGYYYDHKKKEVVVIHAVMKNKKIEPVVTYYDKDLFANVDEVKQALIDKWESEGAK